LQSSEPSIKANHPILNQFVVDCSSGSAHIKKGTSLQRINEENRRHAIAVSLLVSQAALELEVSLPDLDAPSSSSGAVSQEAGLRLPSPTTNDASVDGISHSIPALSAAAAAAAAVGASSNVFPAWIPAPFSSSSSSSSSVIYRHFGDCS